MPSTEEIRNEIRKTLSDPTPLYALAGAGDLAYQKLREVPGRVEALAADRKAAQEAAVARLQEAQGKLVDAQARVVGTVTALPTDLKSLQEKAQEFALQQAGLAAGLAIKAKEVYDELAERGKVVVARPARSGGESVTVERAESVPVDVEEGEAGGGEPAETSKPAAKKTARPRKSPDAGQ
ncbi:hypothetical protein LN042_11055 [Kitasatospora sp. RB6PN24]|uniref:hypothetical protein n=1 Tax=Kitasatospora humi TaxID=2893891 RepID=UPI001E5F8A8E|nr:hypothetical protein [Kitasatospora humi]MCC9307634.1 hypothetical protein [Kitasatospora humi]